MKLGVFIDGGSFLYNPIFPPNPKINFSAVYSNHNRYRSNRLFSNKKIKWEKKSPLVIANCAQKNSQGEEVNNLGVKAALSLLMFYKSEISPLLPKSCRYIPTCSEYSMIAYKKYGFVKGTALTACRLCRCNPLGGSGFDPPRWYGETNPPEQ